MTFHPFSAVKLSERLAAGMVGAREQACYVAGSLVLSISPLYLFFLPGPAEQEWFYAVWFSEYSLLVIVALAA